MRVLAATLLFASGCNQLFGLHDNFKVSDGGPDVYFMDAAYWPMQLTYQNVASVGAPVTYPAIPGATVQIGPIDPAGGPLRTLPIDANGGFLVPTEVPDPDHPYRLIYTVDNIPTEIHSTARVAHFVVPLVGRTERVPPPASAQVEFFPNVSTPGEVLASAELFTVGLWSWQKPATFALAYDWQYATMAKSLSGKLGSLSANDGDLEVIADLDASGECKRYALMSVTDLSTNPATQPSTWMMAPASTVFWSTPAGSGPNDPYPRLFGAIFNYAMSAKASTYWGGVIASSSLPAFAEPNPGGLDTFQFAALSLLGNTSKHQFVNPFTGSNALPLAAFAADTSTRTTGSGAKLTSGFQSIGIPSALPAIDLNYDVGIARAATLKAGTAVEVPLTGNDDAIVFDRKGSALIDLTFTTDRSDRVDDCIATLYAISGTNVTPVRRFLVQTPPTTTPLEIDAGVFAVGTTYTFGIVCRKGQPGAATLDYTTVAYPYITSTVYTPTFKIIN